MEFVMRLKGSAPASLVLCCLWVCSPGVIGSSFLQATAIDAHKSVENDTALYTVARRTQHHMLLEHVCIHTCFGRYAYGSGCG